MKYKEFKERMEQMDLTVGENEYAIWVTTPRQKGKIVVVAKDLRFRVTVPHHLPMEDAVRLEGVLINAARLSCTPLEEREEPKRYRVELETTDSTYILWKATDGSDDTDFININRVTTGKKSFTEQEIKDIDPRYLAFAKEVD